MEGIKAKIDLVLKTNGGDLASDISEYKNAKTKLTWACAHGHKFDSSWNEALS